MVELFKSSTGYKRLDLYVLANIIQLETLSFCRRHLSRDDDPCGRQFDQMAQAARSGVKNLTEGSERVATSMQTALKLLDVAKASLCELRDDYLTFLMDRGLAPWPLVSEESRAVSAVRLDAADYGADVNHDLCEHIIRQRARFARWFGDGADAVTAANALLILIGRSLQMLDRLLRQRGDEFVKEGGFSERMTAARVEEKRSRHEPVAASDDEAPRCPKCGGPMRLRPGRNGPFWGCLAYPGCKGTRDAGGPRSATGGAPETAR